MSKKAKCEASTWSDFKRNVQAGGKSRDMSSIYCSSILFQHSRPSRRSKRVLSDKDGGDRASCEPASMPFSFTKVLLSRSALHTSECCRIILPSEFCKRHNMERNVTMTDSSGRRLWQMRFQSCDSSRRSASVISNGWREFAYDHNLKINDRLVFTVMSTSHFLVEFSTSNGSTCAMLPKRNGNDYPWRINYSRLDCLSFADVHGGKEKRICKNVHDRDEDDEDYANKRPVSTSKSFMKILTPKCGTHTTRCCRLILPREFCAKHNVESYVTMTDSTSHKLWHMRVQSSGLVSSTRPRVYCISNGWREFSYDHSLKVYDRLVFTLLSTSHFLVEFATSHGSNRAMLPTRDGKHYPWQINFARVECLSVANDKSRNKRKVHLKEPELQCVKKRIHKNVQDEEDDGENANNGPASTSRSFTMILSAHYGIHTARLCRLTLPRQFCETHNVEKIVTMTDSKGLRTWPMRMQSSGFVSSTRPRFYCISNGWREFSYDHSLKANDRLVFTLLSTSRLLVEFATSNGSTRAMLPTRDGKHYPWQINFARLECLSVAGDQSGKTRKIQKKVTSSIVIRHEQNLAQKEMMFCQCNTAEVSKEMISSNATRKEYVLPELTHLECKNADGSSYLQIIDSDSDSQMTIPDED